MARPLRFIAPRAAVAWTLFAITLLASSAPSAAAQPPGGVQYALEIDCGPSNVTPYVPGTPATSATGGCPIRATDGDDLMGDPSIAVDPLRPEDLIIASLHGQTSDGDGDGMPDGPSVKARTGQVFTTFTSQDQGQSWVDNPFVPPDDIGFAYGMHPQVAIDPYGQVYVGSLYAIPAGQDGNGSDTFDYVIAAQKFEGIDTINEEQASSNGGYNAEYLTPVYEGNQIDQMWFLFNPVTDNMTLLWRETVPAPTVPPCNTDSSYLVNQAGYYVKADVAAQTVATYTESNGVPDLQTPASCPSNPDDQLLGTANAPAPPAATSGLATGTGTRASSSIPPPGFPALVPAPTPAPAPAGSVQPALPASFQPPDNQSGNSTNSTSGTNSTSPSPSGSNSTSGAPTPSTADGPEATDSPAVGAIGVVWTTFDSDTPYYYQDPDDVIQPCSGSTNPVLSFGWLYVGCVIDTSQGTFRWAPEARNGTVQLFRMDPNGGKPEYMGQAPEMVGLPKLGVRSDGRLALVASNARDGALQLSAAYGQYEPGPHRITWSKQFAVGQDVIPLNPDVRVVDADIQDMVYREQSGALHLILKTTVDYVGGAMDVQDGLGLVPHIQKTIVAIDERYGVLAVLPIQLGRERQTDATIATSPEAAFQDLSDDFLQLPAAPYSYRGQNLGPLYQREFFAIGDYGTVLFAEVVEITTISAPGIPAIPAPVPATPAPATVNLVAPVAGLTVAGTVMGTLVAHRRKNPLAAFTKGE